MKLDPDSFRWIEISEPDSPYPVHHELSILGWDRDAGTLDLAIRFDDRGGHCHSRRHITTTSVLVLEGEQHLDELRPSGERRPHKSASSSRSPGPSMNCCTAR